MTGPWEDYKPKAAEAGPWTDYQKAEQPGMGTSALRGAVQGLTFGLADESYGLMQGIGGMISGEGFSKAYDRGVSEYRGRDKAAKEANPITSTVGEIAGGMGTGLGLAGSGATLMRAGMTLPQAIGRGAIEGAAYGAAYGAGNAEGGLNERAQGAIEGAGIGAGIGGAAPIVARGIGAAVGRAASPVSIPAERKAAISVLEREGVPLSAGQRSGSEALRFAESHLGNAPFAGGQATKAMERQSEAFTDAALRRMGGSGRATPENMSANYDRIGQQFRDLSARNTLQADRQLAAELGATLNKYDRLLPSEQKQIVGNLASDIVERIRAGGGTMKGEDYQEIRSWLSTASQKEGNQHAASAMKGLRDALDNNMMRSIAPEDAAAWQEARRQYGNWKDLAKAQGAGEDAAAGLISPQALRQAVASGKNKEAYVRGEGDFAELVRAGNQILSRLPNSGTAQRAMSASPVGGGMFFAGGGDPFIAAAIALGPGAVGRGLWTGPIQRYIANGSMSEGARKAIEHRVRAALQGGAGSQSPRLSLPSR